MFDIFKKKSDIPEVPKPDSIPESLVDTFVEVWNNQNSGRKLSKIYINSGWCYQFALLFKKALGDKVKLYSDFDGGHCWVMIGELHYDAYNLSGSQYPLSRYGSVRGPLTEEEVINYWNGCGCSGRVQLETIEIAVNMWKLKYQPVS